MNDYPSYYSSSSSSSSSAATATATAAATANEHSVEGWLQGELRFSRSGYVSWGKKVVQAIDRDDAAALADVFLRPTNDNQREAHVDAQVTAASGYGG